jgi:uncharacterized protein (TIGR00290 family)
MHGLRREVLLRQLNSLSIPHTFLELSDQPSIDDYSKLMIEKIEVFKSKDSKYAGFGDIFLEDLRKYREEQLSSVVVEAFFPLWKRGTKTLIENFISEGFKTIVVCVNGEKLDSSFCGRIIDKSFVNDLPDDVDPCGENGEFHTFCFDGPIFKISVDFQIGETITRSYRAADGKGGEVDYYFIDII